MIAVAVVALAVIAVAGLIAIVVEDRRHERRTARALAERHARWRGEPYL